MHQFNIEVSPCAEMPIVLILNLKCTFPVSFLVCYNDLTSVNLYQHGLCGGEKKQKKNSLQSAERSPPWINRGSEMRGERSHTSDGRAKDCFIQSFYVL